MGKASATIVYHRGGPEGLDAVAGLWDKLRLHHRERSPYFKELMERMTWEERKRVLLEKAREGTLLVETARDNNGIIGYCIASANRQKTGEIESIYIEKASRRRHIGERLMQDALAWMDAQGVTAKIIGVAAGNEEVFPFYRKFGFYPRMTILRQK